MVRTKVVKSMVPNFSKCAWQTSLSWSEVVEQHADSTPVEKQNAFYKFVEEKGQDVENDVIQQMTFQSNLRMIRSRLDTEPDAKVWKMVSENGWCKVWDSLLEVFRRRPEGAPATCGAKNIFDDVEAADEL